MSLITDALGLRQGRSGKKPTRRACLTPFPRPPIDGRTTKVIVGVAVLLAIAAFGFLRGAVAFEWLEGVVLGQPPKIEALNSVRPASPKVITQPETRLTSPQKISVTPDEDKLAPKDLVRQSGDTASPAPPSALPRIEDGKVAGAEVVSRGVELVALHPVLVESPEKIKNMDPKLLEKEQRNRVESFLLNLRVQGVRIHGAESRIMVDGALIGVGDAIGDFGLHLKSVESGRLTFVDTEGQEYPKSY